MADTIHRTTADAIHAAIRTAIKNGCYKDAAYDIGRLEQHILSGSPPSLMTDTEWELLRAFRDVRDELTRSREESERSTARMKELESRSARACILLKGHP